MSIEAAALAFMMGQHTAEETARDAQRKADEVKVDVTFNPASPKPRKGSFDPNNKSHAVHVVSHSTPVAAKVSSNVGSLEARGFLKALRDAKTRDERIFAIDCYVGYNNAQDFGSQLMAAEMQAKREMRGGPIQVVTPKERDAAYRNKPGFVAGIPDVMGREVQNLAARETLAASELIALENKALDKTLPTDQRVLAKGLAAAEGERIEHIRKDLKGFGF